MSASALKANIVFDGSLMYNDVGDAKTQTGFGLSGGFNLNRDISVLFTFLLSETTEDINEPLETTYSYKFYGAGIEYAYPINQIRSSWRSTISVGFSQTKAEPKNFSSEISDDGVAFALSTGLQFNATQRFAPFIDIGYHYSYHTGDFKDDSISGFRVNVGVRFALYDLKNIDSDY